MCVAVYCRCVAVGVAVYVRDAGCVAGCGAGWCQLWVAGVVVCVAVYVAGWCRWSDVRCVAPCFTVCVAECVAVCVAGCVAGFAAV